MEPTAAEVEALLAQGSDGGLAFGPQLAAALATARVWSTEEAAALATSTSGPSPRVEIDDATTRSVVARLGDGVGVLVSAHGTEPGGGFLRGDRGHEEDLCRCSGWWRCANAIPAFHAAHRAAEPLFHAPLIASFTGVPFFRGDAGPLPAVVTATVVAAAAPDARTLTLSGRADADLLPHLRERVRNQLAVFRALGVRRLVLAAFGCGSYGNDPRDVALTYRAALIDGPFGGAFDQVVFAISSEPRTGRPSLAAFHRVFPQ